MRHYLSCIDAKVAEARMALLTVEIFLTLSLSKRGGEEEEEANKDKKRRQQKWRWKRVERKRPFRRAHIRA